MNLTAPIIAASCGASPALAALQGVRAAQQINTPLRTVAFVATVGVENLNDSKEGLLATLPKYVTDAEAQQYARRPRAIANRVHASRYGNGDEASGDGWRYRGRGLIQSTFHDNYPLCAVVLGLPLVQQPDLLAARANAASSAAWWWAARDRAARQRREVTPLQRFFNAWRRTRLTATTLPTR
ncbi:glycoside hydrolase family 19 protein [Burkholderia sp. D-99]|uniref:glycoside hydrolase family 19 protein n=1 Tax=Burkholderia sp. D-99 TaxID=2717316 RepID=UPI0032602731